MNCNCNNNETSVEQVQIKHVYGNVLRLAIPLTLRTIEKVNDEIVATDTAFFPSSDSPVNVVFSKGAVKIGFAATMDGNIAYVEDKGTIPVGTYAITVVCKDDNGNPYRFKQNAVLQVVDATLEAGIETPIEYEVTTWYLDAAIFMALKGEDGVGVEDIQIQQSGEIGGENIVTFILTDGRTESFSVLNGSGAVDFTLNAESSHPVANSVITTQLNNVNTRLAELFGDVEYDSTNKVIRFLSKGNSKGSGNVLATLDARPFIKDGMVSNVYISNNTLVVTFNTDSGHEAIGVSLSSIFNPNNYYTKTQVDNRLNQLYLNIREEVNTKMPLYVPVTINGSTYSSTVDFGTIRNAIQEDNRDVFVVVNGNVYYSLWIVSSGLITFSFIDFEEHHQSLLSINVSNAWEEEEYAIEGGGGSLEQVQADWNQTNTSAVDYIKNKPTIPASVVVDQSITENGTNPVQGGAIYGALQSKMERFFIRMFEDDDTLTFTDFEDNELTHAQVREILNNLQNDVWLDFAYGLPVRLSYTETDYWIFTGVVEDMKIKLLLLYDIDEDIIIIENDYEATIFTDENSSFQEPLESGVNIKTINGQSVLGSGDLPTIMYGRRTQTGFASGVYNGFLWAFSFKDIGLVVGVIYFDVTTAKAYTYDGESLKTVGFSGNYNDLLNKPTIPAAQVQSDWNATTGMGVILNKPTIPTVPTNVSSFTNDAGYLTAHQDISGKADVITKVTNTSSGTASLALDSGKFYVFSNALTALTITALNAPSSGMGIWAGKFTSDSTTACTLSVPASVTEASNNPEIAKGKTYEFSIADNVLLIVEL